MNNRNERTWNEESRNLFHSGTILALIVGQAALSPRGNKELVELTCHVWGSGRELSEAYIVGDSLIAGFYARWVPRMGHVAAHLRELFPELVKYGEQLKTRGFLEDCVDNEVVRNHLFAEIEFKFGHTLTVLPYGQSVVPSSKESKRKPFNCSATTFQPSVQNPQTNKYVILPPINKPFKTPFK
ncbi:MAG: hypothetical protein ACO1N3_04270 [Gammaproteobacteria bacterium]